MIYGEDRLKLSFCVDDSTPPCSISIRNLDDIVLSYMGEEITVAEHEIYDLLVDFISKVI